MVARCFVFAVAVAVAPVTLHAQQAVADSLWKIGQRSEALLAYRRVLAGDSNAVRANFRVAEALAGTNLDSALRFIRNARTRVPTDPDFMFTEAKYLSWGRHFADAIALYDSILVAHADFDYVRVARARVLSWAGHLDAAQKGYADVMARKGVDLGVQRDAQFGLAQIAAWQGNFVSAADQYTSLLASDPNEVRSLVGLGSVRSYQGRPFAAQALVNRALAQDSTDADAIALKKSVAHSRSPAADVSASWSHDTDNNDVSWQTATQSFLVRDGVRLVARVGNQRALDPVRRTSRYLGDASVSFSPPSMQLTLGAGVRQLNVEEAPPGSSPDRAEFTWRAIASIRPLPALGVGLAVERVPFDEIAALLARGINLTNVEASADWRLRAGTNATLSGGTLAFSDGNHRNGGALRLTQNGGGGLSFGFLARTFSFAHKATGYFTPEQFTLADAFASWEYERGIWGTGISGGTGAQRLGPHDPIQSEWHADVRTGLHFANGVSVDISGGASTSAAASAVGAFRYETGGVSVRIPF